MFQFGGAGEKCQRCVPCGHFQALLLWRVVLLRPGRVPPHTRGGDIEPFCCTTIDALCQCQGCPTDLKFAASIEATAYGRGIEIGRRKRVNEAVVGRGVSLCPRTDAQSGTSGTPGDASGSGAAASSGSPCQGSDFGLRRIGQFRHRGPGPGVGVPSTGSVHLRRWLWPRWAEVGRPRHSGTRSSSCPASD